MIRETNYTQAREGFAALLDQVTDTREPVLIKRRGKEAVALIAADELAGWLETAHLLRSPKNARRLLEANRRADAGEGEAATAEELRRRPNFSHGGSCVAPSKLAYALSQVGGFRGCPRADSQRA